ncbi:unnamed protein product, partial [Ixodes hexagonus]
MSRWYRGLIERLADDGNVEVFFPDYGDSGVCRLEEVYELPAQMLLLPLQGIQCRLAGVSPASGQWTPEASSALEDFGYTADDLNKMLLLRVLNAADFCKNVCICYQFLAARYVGEGRLYFIEDAVALLSPVSASTLPVVRTYILFRPLPRSRQASSSSASEDDLCEENMNDHMDQLYGHIRDHLLREMEQELASAEKVPVPAMEEKHSLNTSTNSPARRTADHRKASKATSTSKVPLLESILVSSSR